VARHQQPQLLAGRLDDDGVAAIVSARQTPSAIASRRVTSSRQTIVASAENTARNAVGSSCCTHARAAIAPSRKSTAAQASTLMR
jgi:hypothetical protein